MDDETRRARSKAITEAADARLREIVERSKAAGLRVTPKFVDKLDHPRGVFNRGRKQTI